MGGLPPSGDMAEHSLWVRLEILLQAQRTHYTLIVHLFVFFVLAGHSLNQSCSLSSYRIGLGQSPSLPLVITHIYGQSDLNQTD